MISGCQKHTAGIKDYIRYMNNPKNGLVQEKEIDGMVFKVRYLTPELMALNELKSVNVNAVTWQKTLKQYDGLVYGKITVAAKGGEHILKLLNDQEIDGDGVDEYLNYKAQNDIMMLDGKDTAGCVLYNYSKTYGLARQLDLAVGFNAANTLKGDRVIEFNPELLQRGLLKFRFKQGDIDNIPRLTF